MRSSENLNNNNNSNIEYNCSWTPYLAKIDEIINQLGAASLLSKPITYHGKPLDKYILYATLDLNLPNAVVFILSENDQHEILVSIVNKIHMLSGFKAMSRFNSVLIQFPSFSKDEKENYEIKKFIFYHLAAGADFAAFKNMDELYENSPPYPRILFKERINFISKTTSFQINRNFDKISSPLELTFDLAKEANNMMAYIFTCKNHIADMDDTIKQVSFGKFKDKLFISIPPLRFKQQRRLFYELFLTDDIDSIGTFEQLFAMERFKLTHTATFNLTSQDCKNLFEQYDIDPKNVSKPTSNMPQQHKRQLSEDENNNATKQHYSDLFKQYRIPSGPAIKASDYINTKKCRRIEKQDNETLVMPDQLSEQASREEQDQSERGSLSPRK